MWGEVVGQPPLSQGEGGPQRAMTLDALVQRMGSPAAVGNGWLAGWILELAVNQIVIHLKIFILKACHDRNLDGANPTLHLHWFPPGGWTNKNPTPVARQGLPDRWLKRT